MAWRHDCTYVLRVEVAAGRGAARAHVPLLVDVEAVLAGRQAGDVAEDDDGAVADLDEGDVALDGARDLHHGSPPLQSEQAPRQHRAAKWHIDTPLLHATTPELERCKCRTLRWKR